MKKTLQSVLKLTNYTVKRKSETVYEVFPPYYMMDGTGVHFYLVKAEGGYQLTDCGCCMFNLSNMSCIDWDYERLEKYANEYLDGILKDGEMVTKCEEDLIADSMLDMTRAFLILEIKAKEWGFL